jgi:hypothetical protein
MRTRPNAWLVLREGEIPRSRNNLIANINNVLYDIAVSEIVLFIHLLLVFQVLISDLPSLA